MEATHSSEALIAAFQATQQLSSGNTIDGFHCLEDLCRKYFYFIYVIVLQRQPQYVAGPGYHFCLGAEWHSAKVQPVGDRCES